MRQSAWANVLRASRRLRLGPLLPLYFAQSDCLIPALRSVRLPPSPLWGEGWGEGHVRHGSKARGGAARPGEIKEEERPEPQAKGRAGDIRRDG